MNQSFLEKDVKSLQFQRNIFSASLVILSVALAFQSVFLFSKRERIIVVPPKIEKEFWVDSDSVSESYLEQMGAFLGSLALAKSSESYIMRTKLLLKYTSPSFEGALRQQLTKEFELLKRENASYVFFPFSIQTNARDLTVLLEGDRILYAGGKEISNTKESYEMSFEYSGGRILLTGIEFKGKKS